jgi:hypothetical protein
MLKVPKQTDQIAELVWRSFDESRTAREKAHCFYFNVLEHHQQEAVETNTLVADGGLLDVCSRSRAPWGITRPTFTV